MGVGGFPYGSHVCEVEIDLDLGTVEIVGYAAVDDVGRAVNPRILHGQSHGGIAQGIGQALLESCVYDRESGQLLSGSFTDYAIPRADDLLPFATEISEVLSPNNPLGVRAGGEGGTTPALAVVVGARGRRAQGVRRNPHGNAGHARAGVARDSGETGARSHLTALHWHRRPLSLMELARLPRRTCLPRI